MWKYGVPSPHDRDLSCGILALTSTLLSLLLDLPRLPFPPGRETGNRIAFSLFGQVANHMRTHERALRVLYFKACNGNYKKHVSYCFGPFLL